MIELKKVLKTNGRYIQILAENGIHTVADLLQYFPRAYEDRSSILTLKNLYIDGQTTIATKGQIIEKKFSPRGGKKVYEIMFQDQDRTIGYINLYNTGYLAKALNVNSRYVIVGKASAFKGKIVFRQPQLIPSQVEDTETNDYSVGRLYPIYPELQGINASRFAKKIRECLPYIKEVIDEPYTDIFLKEFNIMHIHEAVHELHFPRSYESKEKALYRIFFDRLLRIQLFSQMSKDTYQQNWHIANQSIKRDVIKYINQTLPFELTTAQKKVIKQIIENLHLPKPMLQLLQGDVGSGKTIVAAIAAYYVIKHLGGQVAFIAPLEILAQQHLRSIAKVLLPLGIKMGILTWSISKAEKDKTKEQLASGQLDIVIGTHAVLQENVTFKDLQLAVIDEQHKFGVMQRAFFRKFNSPHIIQMSATPIPRSMALAFFGEFEVSIIDQMPAGRIPIHTKIISNAERRKIKPRIMTKINQGQKVFIVTPLIEESDKLEDVQAATAEFEETRELFAEIKDKVGLMHGKMKSKDKDAVMQGFKTGKYAILVATTVIEVGVDIPEATIMIIKNAERFGLSQLHQLRWRIGRSSLQSYCFLQTAKKWSDSYKRLKSLEETSDGFRLAELDMKQRGPGELLGLRQSGIADIPLEILTNIKFLETIQIAAKWLLDKYPNLEHLDYLKKHLTDAFGDLIA